MGCWGILNMNILRVFVQDASDRLTVDLKAEYAESIVKDTCDGLMEDIKYEYSENTCVGYV